MKFPREPSILHAMRPLRVVLLLLLALGAPSHAEPPSSDRHSQLSDLTRGVAPKQEVEILWKLVQEQPQNPQAERALTRIASICEQQLGDFDRAEEAYRLLIELNPEGRRTALARKRLADLRDARASGDEPLRRYNRILRESARLPVASSLREMNELLASYPDFARRDHILFLAGVLLASRGKHADATQYLEELIEAYPESQWFYAATNELGQCYIELRRFDAAERAFESLLDSQERIPGTPERVAYRIRFVHRFRLLRWLFSLSLAVTGLACLVWIFGTRWRNLGWGDGITALAVTLVQTGVFLTALYNMPREYERLCSALLYSWIALVPAGVLGALWLCTRRPGVIRAVAASLAVLVAALAIAYTVYYQQDAAALLLDSIQGSGIMQF